MEMEIDVLQLVPTSWNWWTFGIYVTKRLREAIFVFLADLEIVVVA